MIRSGQGETLRVLGCPRVVQAVQDLRIQSAFRLVRERAAENDVKLTLALSENTPSLMADARAVKQVLLNLLSNAVKFTPSGGSVVVNTTLSDRGDF